MARLTARIQRLEALDQVRARDADANLSEVELDAQLCRRAEKLTTGWRNRRMSAADIVAEHPHLRVHDRVLSAMMAEVQAPAFDAERFLAAVKNASASCGEGEPDAVQ